MWDFHYKILAALRGNIDAKLTLEYSFFPHKQY